MAFRGDWGLPVALSYDGWMECPPPGVIMRLVQGYQSPPSYPAFVAAKAHLASYCVTRGHWVR